MKSMYDFSETEKEQLYLDVIKNWGKETAETIAARWNVKKCVVGGIASRLRKRGIALPKGNVSGFLTEERLQKFKEAFESR